ncbi:MAG: hypothetical protein HYZ74_07730 [Elusimicrobia bacterium]|nr:hypothetical protein [Elusimicrobiota bacterium]
MGAARRRWQGLNLQNLSGTVASASTPWLNITPSVVGKMTLSTVLMACGMYYLASGRKEADVSRMITGAILTLLSIFVF